MTAAARRSFMRASLHDRAPVDDAGLRCPTAGDVAALGALMLRAYEGTIDDEGETLEQAVAEVARTFAGAYGRFDAEHSRLAERAGRIVSATLVTHWQDRPFVAFTMTDPAFARQGLARLLLQCVMHRLSQDGAHELRLVVTLDNTPALRLYESLGFVIGE